MLEVAAPPRACEYRPPARAARTPPASIDNNFAYDNCRKNFTQTLEFPPMVADMNGDGIDDLILAVRTKSPMLDAGGFEYTVSDPYHSFYGFGDPKVTSAFTTDDPSRKSIVLLVIHGSGPEAWRAEKP